ncbi:aspartyl-tRNA synthetase cytoplasmic [Sparassis latifolia]|uniref:aspartate--tRNA ligase n=1 Tax=Sparassis crispa TaxID=139825 RepID=A0A401GHF5_9APHY|nr:Aspartate--tRNA ligase, cytoplasmic [Sparassis crispa]GBE81627.1 Aspartate--tRNA ligase, cytoplasmic [Sparassis crispa]
MSSLRKALSAKVKSHSLHSSSNSSSPSPERSVQKTNGDPHPLLNGCTDKHANRDASRAQVDNTDTEGEMTAQQQEDTRVTQPLQRPSTELNPHMSFTQQKEGRRHDREQKDEEETKNRREQLEKIHQEDPLRDNWGNWPLPMSQERTSPRLRSTLKSVSQMPPGDYVAFRARIHHLRPLGVKILFVVFRSQLTTLQGVLAEDSEHVSEHMIRWAEGLNRETVVYVEGVVQTPPADQEEVHSTSVHNREIRVQKLFVVAAPSAILPFQVQDVSRSLHVNDKEFPAGRVGDNTRLSNRVLDLRSSPSQAIFRIHAGVCALFREFLVSRGFLEIQSSKFQESSTESGAAVFKVDYFRRPAFLAQSPQLAKQMCIAADMERVFEIGPVFRAENSNTHRHLTEFTGLDLEMSFDSHYWEVLDMIDEMLKYIFKGLQCQYRDEIEAVKHMYPSDDVVILDKTPRLKFADGIRMLKQTGWKEEDGSEPSEWEDLSTRAEQRLGQVIKEKYGTDYYILDKFPADVRPFYTMPDPHDNRLSNSFDIFLRGEEILSGGQRIHHAPLLEQRMMAAGIDLDSMKDYVDGFRWGCPPHGGGGIGLERVVMLFLKLGDVRWGSLFPRDPRSFPKNGADLAEAHMTAAMATILHGPESTTFKPGCVYHDLPPLENLIAKYGDASNTSWIDPAWTIWRDKTTGAAVGYIPHGAFAVAFGNPLCEHTQIPAVCKAFLAYVESQDLKPLWCCVDKEAERYLAEDLGWSAIIAVAEERLNPIEVDPASDDKTARRKIHRAEREGVKVVEVSGDMDPQVREELERRCKEWEESRKGTQIHLTGVRPFDDMVHRKYFYARDKNQEICALVVLAQLSPTHGFQIKWALEFDGAPNGAIEYILASVIKKLGDAGVRSATFGAGAAPRLQRADNVGGFRVRTLERIYNGLSHTFHLMNKGDFRSKFGIHQDPLYICYPSSGLGMRGIEAIMSVLQTPK